MFISRGRSVRIRSTRDLPVAEALQEALSLRDARVTLYAPDGSRIHVEVSSDGRAGCIAETGKGLVEGLDCLRLLWEASGKENGVVEVIQLTPEQTRLDLDSRPSSLIPGGPESLAPATTSPTAPATRTAPASAQPAATEPKARAATAEKRREIKHEALVAPATPRAPGEPPARLVSRAIRRVSDIIAREARTLLDVVRSQTDKLDTVEEVLAAFRPIIERAKDVLRRLEREVKTLDEYVTVFEGYMQPKDYTATARTVSSLVAYTNELRESVKLANNLLGAVTRYSDLVPVDMETLGEIQGKYGPDVAEVFAKSGNPRKLAQNTAKTVKKRLEKTLKSIVGMEKHVAKTRTLIEQTLRQHADKLLKPPTPPAQQPQAATHIPTPQQPQPIPAPAPATRQAQPRPATRPSPPRPEPVLEEVLTRHGFKVGDVFDFATAAVTLIAGKETSTTAKKKCAEALLDLAPLKKQILLDCQAHGKRLVAHVDPEKSLVEVVLEEENGQVLFGAQALRQASRLEAERIRVYIH